MDRPIVLCGLGRMGRRVLDYLVAADLPVVVIDTAARPDEPLPPGARLVVGDCRRREVLEGAGVARARGVLALTKNDQLNITTALVARGLNADARVVLRLYNQNLLGRLGRAIPNVFALSTSLLTAPTLAMTALTGQVLCTYRLDDSPEGARQVVELTVGPSSPLCGTEVASVGPQYGVAVVAHFPAGGGGRSLDLPPGEVLRAGDQVVLHGSPRQLAPLLAPSDGGEQALRWANWLRRQGRAAWRAAREVDLAVLVCAAVLFVVVAMSTLVLRANVEGYDLPKALLRTVSVMATVGALPDEKYDSIRVFVSGLRIVGAVLMAAFTAIVTQYLLRAKLGGVLEVRRVPEAGHFVVCGLSPVGFRVVEELVRLGERVVVINDNPAGRFVTTARRLGAVVMTGDASVVEVLRQANAGAARAVVPTTSNDMTNLEVALLVRELNPEVRVVPLLDDPAFAQMLRDAAGVRLAVSEAGLAAPAFLAGLYGDRVECVFLSRDRLFAVIDLVIGGQDALAGEPIESVVALHRLLPLTLARQGDKPSARPPAGTTLAAGDRLVGLIELGDLDSLFRHQSAQVTRPFSSKKIPDMGKG